jgi:hypothetical protein
MSYQLNWLEKHTRRHETRWNWLETVDMHVLIFLCQLLSFVGDLIWRSFGVTVYQLQLLTLVFWGGTKFFADQILDCSTTQYRETQCFWRTYSVHLQIRRVAKQEISKNLLPTGLDCCLAYSLKWCNDEKWGLGDCYWVIAFYTKVTEIWIVMCSDRKRSRYISQKLQIWKWHDFICFVICCNIWTFKNPT